MIAVCSWLVQMNVQTMVNVLCDEWNRKRFYFTPTSLLLMGGKSFFSFASFSYLDVAANSPGYVGTPSPAGYQPSPSPGGYAGTPSPAGIGFSPMTPGAPFTPQTPGTGNHCVCNRCVIIGCFTDLPEMVRWIFLLSLGSSLISLCKLKRQFFCMKYIQKNALLHIQKAWGDLMAVLLELYILKFYSCSHGSQPVRLAHNRYSGQSQGDTRWPRSDLPDRCHKKHFGELYLQLHWSF